MKILQLNVDDIEAVLIRDDGWRQVESIDVLTGLEFGSDGFGQYAITDGLWLQIRQSELEPPVGLCDVLVPISSILAFRLKEVDGA